MSVTEILSEIDKLSPDEKQQIVVALLHDTEIERAEQFDERHLELFRRLQAKGMLKRIPTRRPLMRDFEPIPIEGKPLSETIIEERR